MPVDDETIKIANTLLTEIRKAFDTKVVALFSVSEDETKVSCFGTGFLFEVNRNFFCITAHHVIKDILLEGKLVIQMEVKVQEDCIFTDAGLDIAFIKISGIDASRLTDLGRVFMNVADFKLSYKKHTDFMLVPMGYPEVLTSVDYNKRKISFRPFCFYTHFEKKKGLSVRKSEISLAYSAEGWKNALDQDAAQVNIRGMSGCPIIEAIVIKEPFLNYSFRVIAMGNEWDENSAIISGKYSGSILRAFLHKFPEFTNHIESEFDFLLKNSL